MGAGLTKETHMQYFIGFIVGVPVGVGLMYLVMVFHTMANL